MKYIFLDLDGTITDSREGITNCFEYALNHFGIKVENKADLEQFIGPPLEQSFREGFGFDEEKAEQAVATISTFPPSFRAFKACSMPS